MARYISDIETNGLLQECTRLWIVGVKNIDTGVVQYWLEGDLGWQKVFDEADQIVGHNFLGFDIPALEKLTGWKPPKKLMIIDTLLMSQVQDYKRFGNRGHSLEVWGENLGYPKGDTGDPAIFFSKYSEEMLEYWKRDMELGGKVYNVLGKELKEKAAREPIIRTYLKAEHAAAKFVAQASLRGWPFNIAAAESLFGKLTIEMDVVRAKILPKLGFKAVAVDKANGVVPWKEAKWTKIGAYYHHLATWFNIDPMTGQDWNRLVEGPYSRVEIVPLDIDSIDDVKIFLYRHDWIPTEYNTKVDPNTGRKVNTSGKITEDSLQCMEGDGKLYCDFLTTKSRYSILKGWLEKVDRNNPLCPPGLGILHGDCMTIGTPSMRARHSIIVNVPAAESVLGPEMRALFTTLPGWKLIGCDSAGNQARGLAHYLESEEFTQTLLNGDIHQYNADVLTQCLAEMGIKHTVPRPRAKRILYAFLFGASGGKLWSYIFDKPDEKRGKKLKSLFTKAVPGFKKLLEKLENIFGKTQQWGDGYIPGIGGNRIYCDSFHKLLVYLLQACEKATCAAAVMLTMERLEEKGIEYWPVMFMHDEEDFLVPDEHAVEAAAIGKQAFKDGPKLFGVQIMDGDAKIGENWYEVH